MWYGLTVYPRRIVQDDRSFGWDSCPSRWFAEEHGPELHEPAMSLHVDSLLIPSYFLP
jgi:hypothetical protein